MPEQTEAASEDAPREPKVRRISNKNPRKTVDADTAANEVSAPPPSGSDPSPSLDPKRGNRRRRGKGKAGRKESEPSPAAEPSVEETISLAPEETKPRSGKMDTPPPPEKQQETRPQPQKPRRKPDPEKVAKNAWKIYLAEVSEEGVALIGDNDARELARRCFRLSEIFLEEEERRG